MAPPRRTPATAYFKTDDEVADERARDIRALETTNARRLAATRRRAARAAWITLSIIAIVPAAVGWFVWRYNDAIGHSSAPAESR